jgi:signal transduction histidine kinase
VIQELFAIGMGIQGLATVTDEPASVARLVGYVDGIDHVIRAIRTTIFQLQPHRHDSTGLQERVLDIAATHTAQLGYSPNVRFAGLLDLTVDEALAADVLAVLREGISNCARHAAATRLDISLAVGHERLVLEMIDNGRGVGDPARSSGLTNMRRRAERHHGEFTIAAPASGGTHLTWTARAHPPAAR